MSSNAGTTAQYSLQPPRGERSRLLAFNRKLRHLHGITLRNLNLGPSQLRARGKTIDDEALPSALKTPAKILAASEGNRLAPSRSFTDLKSPAATLDGGSAAPSGPAPTASSPQTPKPRQPRRKSTLDWASPGHWQVYLREALSKSTADVFLSLHCPEIQDPVYISEVVHNTSNPNFQFFDLNTAGASISRQDCLIINFWACKGNSKSWQHVLELFVNLRTLRYIGRSLENYPQPLPENCVILHLQDGLYVCGGDLLSDAPKHQLSALVGKDAMASVTSPTSSYDALMRLSTLDQCIQEAIVTREKLTAEINDLIAQDKDRFYAKNASNTAEDSLSSVERAQMSEKRQIKVLRARLTELRSNLAQRREAINTGRAWQESTSANDVNNETQLDTLRASSNTIQTLLQGQRRRICSELSAIYPIEPIPNKSLQFTIRGLPLANSSFNKADISQHADTISAALGHIAHVVYLLSHYLSVPLPYPPTPHSSTSTIYDPISISLSTAPINTSHAIATNQNSSTTPQDPNRIFPLHITKSSPFYRFEYGLFLLNKDIELLASKLGLRILDIRQTLPNLKYILFVATAGDGEVPLRKAGGVRGLLYASGMRDLAEKGEDVSENESRPGSSSGGGRTLSGVSTAVESLRSRSSERTVANGLLGKKGVLSSSVS